jgi:transcription elongation factor GreA
MELPMSENGSSVAWLTQDAFDRLKIELDYLSGEGRVEIAKKIEAARAEGDLKENGGYHAAKDEQGQREARIRQLRQLLDNAQVGEAVVGDGTVGSGSVVTLEMAGEEMTFLLGSREVAGTTDMDVYSESSPLGSAIAGHKVGDSATYTAPNGRQISVKILNSKPFNQ